MKSRKVIALLMALVLIVSGSPYLAATLLFSHGHHHVSTQRQGTTTTLVFHHHEGKDTHDVGHSTRPLDSSQAIETDLVLVDSYFSDLRLPSEETNDHAVQLLSQSVKLPSRQLRPTPKFEPILFFSTSARFVARTILDRRLSALRVRDDGVVPQLSDQLCSVILLI